MPIYEYRCRECNKVFEVLTLSSSDPGIGGCPACGSKEADKLVSAGSLRVGSGPAGLSTPPGCKARGGFS